MAVGDYEVPVILFSTVERSGQPYVVRTRNPPDLVPRRRLLANKEIGCDASMAALTSLISECDTFLRRSPAPWAFARMDVCAIYAFNEWMNQSIN
jgi:hypothetical protein